MKKVKTLIVSGIILLTICTIIYLLIISNDIKQYTQAVNALEINPYPDNSFIEVLGKLIKSFKN